MLEPVRVIVADDHPLLRTGIVETIARHPDLAVVGEASNAADACQLAIALRPSIALMDIAMPGDTFLAVRSIIAASPETKIVMLTASSAQDDLLQSLRSGAKGYVLKGTGGAELVRVLLAINGGGAYVPPELATAALVGSSRTRMDFVGRLTGREDTILDHVGRGMTNKEVAIKLSMAEKTVKHHMTKIMEKLRVRNRVEAAMFARDRNSRRYSGTDGSTSDRVG
jgi:two-component system nitrate/nitrite response regulator NarL